MKTALIAAALLAAAPAAATGISTHVLDLAKGTGGKAVPVVLEMKGANGWSEVARGCTDEAGRIRSFGREDHASGVYRLRFDMTAYHGPQAFFPEITIAFQVAPGVPHVHVPLAVSPFGYSTYRGN